MDRLLNGAMLGPYRIIQPIAEGGMARIYKAYQPSMERYVALKVLPSHYAEEPEFIERFNREARTIARLEHKNILPVFDFGEQEGITYLAMRYMEGGTLKELLSHGRLTLRDTLEIMTQVCSALDYAHRQGVVHRDVKPSNVIIDSEGAAFLTDFGIAKVLGQSSDLTASGVAVGTPSYMAPEQAMGSKVDSRTDIYALGIVLYEMVVGRVPFQADTPMAVLMAHLRDPLPLPREVNPDIPEAVEMVIVKALAKEPGDRYQTANELGLALKQAIYASTPEEVEPTLMNMVLELRKSRQEKVVTQAVVDTGVQERLEQNYITGLSAYWIRDWEKARLCFQTVVAIDSKYKDAATRLAEVEKQLKLAEVYEQAKSNMDKSDWRAALEALRRVITLDKDYLDAASRLADVEKQLELAELYSQARELHQAGQWQAVVKIFERIQIIDKAFPDPQELLPKARQNLVEQHRQEKLKAVYQHGLQAMEAGHWKEAQKLFEQVRAQQPGYQDTELLLQRIAGERTRLRQKARPIAKTVPAAPATPLPQIRKLPRWLWVLVGGLSLVGVIAGLAAVAFTAGWLDRGKVKALLRTFRPDETPVHTLQAAAQPTALPEPLPRLVRDDSGVPMALVSAGRFLMGSKEGNPDERPVHAVFLSDYYIDLFEVTNARYRQCVEAGACQLPPEVKSFSREHYYDDPQFENYPLLWVSWEDASKYCAWRGTRLPTEAEWEKAARGGLVGQPFPWSQNAEPLQANICDRACLDPRKNPDLEDGFPETSPVGSFAPNGFGLYDMLGNVWEWVSDWYSPDYYQVSPDNNPPGPHIGKEKVLRGGAWDNELVTVSNRNRAEMGTRHYTHSFRCAAVPDASFVGVEKVIPPAQELSAKQPKVPCTPPPAGLVGWWAGDRDATNETRGGTGELRNGASFDPGMVDWAFKFDATGWEQNLGDFVVIPLSPEIKDLRELTVEAWVFLDPERPREGQIEEFVVIPKKFIFRKDADGRLQFIMGIDGVNQHLSSEQTIPRGKFIHLAVTYDGIFMRLFLNGKEVGALRATGEVGDTEHFWLSHPVETLQGRLDEVTIYRRALSPDEVQAIYQAGKSGKCKP